METVELNISSHFVRRKAWCGANTGETVAAEQERALCRWRVREHKLSMFAILFVSLLVVHFYLYFTTDYDYWKRKGIAQLPTFYPFGSSGQFFLMRKSITQVSVEVYQKFPKEKLVGGYRFWYPELIIRDPDIAKQILVTDFSYFYPRGIVRTEHVEPLMKNLFFADGDIWKLLRQRMTPAFTSGKLKAMFPLIVERAERLQARALAAIVGGEAIDARELMARYTTDFIGACGFGLDADSLGDDDSAFRKLGAKIFKTSVQEILVMILKEVNPQAFRNLRYLGKIERELVGLVKTILEKRYHKPSGRNDFIDLLLECKEMGTIVGESIEIIKSDGTPETAKLEMDDALIAAQVFIFFAAGFETSSSATSFALHQLAYNPKVQRKVQEELDKVLFKYDNKLCYDAVKEMTYLEWTFKESLRIFPSLGFLVRQCARKYTVPELNVTIDKGTRIYIPVQALQNDPIYFESPEEFRPERFDPETNDVRSKFVYLPFGEGPRSCIGARLGMMQSMAGLAAILSKFTVRPTPQTVRRPVVDPKGAIVQTLKHGLPLQFEKRFTTV